MVSKAVDERVHLNRTREQKNVNSIKMYSNVFCWVWGKPNGQRENPLMQKQ